LPSARRRLFKFKRKQDRFDGQSQRGFTLAKEEPDTLSVQPYQRLTRDDCARIRRWKPDLLALVSNVPSEAVQ
jgi:hypothetical protein